MIRKLKVAVINNLLMKVTFKTAGPLLRPGDPALQGIAHRILFDSPITGTRPECITWAAVAVKPPGHDSTYKRNTLGPFGVDCDLRRWGLKLGEQGGRNGKKRGDRHRTKTGSAVASPVGERRSVRTVAQ